MNRKISWYGITFWRCAALAAIAATALTACGGDDNPAPTPAAGFSSQPFSFFTEKILGAGADSTPVPVNGVNFDFDVNDDPNAFAYALM